MARDAFDRRLWPFLTYAQHGMSAFLSMTLDYPDSFPAREPLVSVRPDDSVNGFADFRIAGDGVALLSYICVHPDARGRGIATSLIDRFLRDHPELTHLELDVFRENTPAIGLYQKLGFEVVNSSVWMTRDVPTPRAQKLRVLSLHASLAAHGRYGFCELDALFDGENVGLGLMGSGVVKCTSIGDFENDALLAAVRHTFDGVTTAFLVTGEAAASEIMGRYDVANVTDRMSLQLLPSDPLKTMGRT